MDPIQMSHAELREHLRAALARCAMHRQADAELGEVLDRLLRKHAKAFWATTGAGTLVVDALKALEKALDEKEA